MTSQRVPTGLPGLDDVLSGGLRKNHNALIRGPPGAGKTIFGLHFLSDGVDNGQTALYINLGEPGEYVKETVEHFDLNPDGIHFLDLSPSHEDFDEGENYSVFSSAEVEQPSFIEELRSTVEDLNPDRVLLDPITEFRYLTTDERQFRKQILSFLDFLRDNGATVIFTSQASDSLSDDDLQFLTDTVINLETDIEGSTLHVSKFRGSSYQRGKHSYEITDDGVTVFPKLQPGKWEPEQMAVTSDKLSSGIPEVDELLKGGIDAGTVTFVSGPTGAGKTTTALQFIKEAAGRGEQSVMYSFEESPGTIQKRSRSINLPIEAMLEQGTLSIEEIAPNEYTPNEFTSLLKTAVEDDEVRIVLIDGLQGFKQNLRGYTTDPEDVLLRIVRYLRAAGVSTIITNEVTNITGEFRVTEESVSNLADNILYIRYVEMESELGKVIGVLKMRTGDFERSLREFEITEYGIRVGEPLEHMQGILTGTPSFQDHQNDERSRDGD
ncbi:ATPase domain-containing protein [Halopenitus sp. POP-27]|uniref:ATPase domain-containing protein n=1 Tax=Halopenitus sp. POP-27 TaxID=2994425 RepID=UPI0024697D26|nr:ATPase domain-containing protein [Halopenitus sp. POP-27]